MTIKTVVAGSLQRHVDQVAAVQASVNAETLLAGSEIDARLFDSLAYSYQVATNTVTVNVYGALSSDFSDERQLQTQNVAAAGINFYTTTPPLYAYYRVKILSTVGGAHGTVTLRGLAK